MVARGEVRWLELEEEGRRPVVVVTRDEPGSRRGHRMLTSRAALRMSAFEVLAAVATSPVEGPGQLVEVAVLGIDGESVAADGSGDPVAVCHGREAAVWIRGCPRATLSHMEIGVRDLRNRTAQVIDAVQSGERVILTVHGEPVADIVPHGRRTRWLPGESLRAQLRHRAADPQLSGDLDELAGQTLDEL